MRLACSTRSFPLDNLALCLARIQWAGFRAAEIALPRGTAELSEPDGLRQLLEKNELELSGIDAGTLVFGSEEEALEAAAHVGRCAVLARRLDGPRHAADFRRELRHDDVDGADAVIPATVTNPSGRSGRDETGDIKLPSVVGREFGARRASCFRRYPQLGCRT